jgi:hypothetical protein
VAIHRIPEPDFRRHLFHAADKFFEKILLNQDAGARRADLALIDKDAEQRALRRSIDVRIREEDIRRFARVPARPFRFESATPFKTARPVSVPPVKATLSTFIDSTIARLGCGAVARYDIQHTRGRSGMFS